MGEGGHRAQWVGMGEGGHRAQWVGMGEGGHRAQWVGMGEGRSPSTVGRNGGGEVTEHSA